jgi:class 3 adenylate cyclase
MEYTVIGRPVDLTEDLARQASEGILVSARTASLAGDGLVFERRDRRAGVECFEPRVRVGD